MIDSLQITIEPRRVFLCKCRRGEPVIKEFRIEMIWDGMITNKTELYREDEFVSFFDQIFDKAKRQIKEALFISEQQERIKRNHT